MTPAELRLMADDSRVHADVRALALHLAAMGEASGVHGAGAPSTPGESYGTMEARRIIMAGCDKYADWLYINNAYKHEGDVPKLAVHLDRAHAAGSAAAIEAVAKWLVLRNAVGWATKIRALAKEWKP